MARSIHKLSDAFAKSSSLAEGRYADGGGLYLSVKDGGSRSWLFMFKRDGKRKAIGLGPFPEIKLAVARRKAEEIRIRLAEGLEPLPEQGVQQDPTFAECAELFLQSMESQWRNEKHRAQWRMTLGEAYCKTLLDKRVSTISTEDVLRVLNPVWTKKPETASRLRGRIERVIDYAKARGWRADENPALWRGHLKSVLPPRQKLTRGHHAAMDYRNVPDFVTRLREAQSMAARALEFLILCASRSGEVLNAQWHEFNLEDAIWIVPAERMKAGRQHRVPLTEACLRILKQQLLLGGDGFVFPGQKPGKPLSVMSMQMQMRRMGAGAFTVHGFRSSFRDWAGEETNHPREVAEAALAHVVGDATERAYRRSDALEKRRDLMGAWSSYLEGDSAGA